MKKVLISLVVIGVFAFVGASSAFALSVQEVLDLRDAGFTTDQIVAMFGDAGGSTGSTGSAYTPAGFTLRVGSTGSAVSALQTALNSFGGAALVVDGSYGPATKAAVMSFQASKGLVADGIAGPLTQGALQTASAGSGSDDDSDDDFGDSSSGAEGQLTSFEEDAPDVTEVDEGQNDKEVINVSFEADDADQKITRVDVDFQAADSTESDKPWDYFDEVSLLFEGEIIATRDADSSSDWDKTEESTTYDTWSMRFSGLDLMIEEDEEVQLGVAVSVLTNVDGNDEGQSWEVAIPVNGIRAVSPNGLSETYPTSELNEDFTVAGSDTGTLKFSQSADNPDAMALSLDDTVDTDDVLLAVYRMEADNQDIFLEDLLIYVDITETGTATTMNQIVETFYLVIDGKTYAESASTSALDADITFNNVDYTIEDGDIVEFEIRADFQPLDGTIVVAGDTIAIDIDASDVIAEQASGGDAGDSITPTGDIAGNDHAYFTDAPIITLVSSTITKTLACDGICASGEAERAEAVIKYTVEAPAGQDIYLPDEFAQDTDETDTTYGTGSTFYVDETGSANTATASLLATSDSAAETDTNGWVVRAGQKAEFTASVTVTANADGYYAVGMTSIEWATSSTAGGSATDYTYSMYPDWETDSVYLEMTA